MLAAKHILDKRKHGFEGEERRKGNGTPLFFAQTDQTVFIEQRRIFPARGPERITPRRPGNMRNCTIKVW